MVFIKARDIPGWATVGLFLIVAFAAIAASRNFLMPVTMAILLFFVFAPFRRWMERRGIPEWISAVIVLFGLIAVLFGLALLLVGPAADLIDSAPTFAAKIEEKISGLTGPLQELQSLADRIDTMTGAADAGAAGGDGGGAAVPDSSAFIMALVEMAPQLLTQIVFVLLLLFFMMSTGDLLYLKIVQSFPNLSTKRKAYSALRTIEQSLGSYFSTITAINAGLGTAIGLSLWAWGMPAPAFFGVIGFLLNFIPYFGVVVGASAATIVALVSLDGFFTPVLVGATYVGLSAIEGQLITPMLVSRRLAMNTVVVFLAVALWAWLWSVVGMIVAVPLLVVMRVLCDHIPGLERVGNFLGGEDPAPLGPEASEKDAEEAAAQHRGEAPKDPAPQEGAPAPVAARDGERSGDYDGRLAPG